MVKLILLAIFSYMIGAIPTGVIIGRLGYGINLQNKGSGNIGTANALKVLGTFPALIVFTGDVGKALLVLSVTRGLGFSENIQWWMGILAIIGHIYPIYLNFRGGKGLATGVGLMVFKEPLTVVVFLFLWIFVYLFSKHVAFSSVIGVLGVVFYLILLGIVPGIIGCIIIIIRHIPEAWTFLSSRLKKEV